MSISYLEELKNRIPGYMGYDKIDDRENTDKSFREKIADIVQKTIDILRRSVVLSRQEITEDKRIMIQQLLFRLDSIVTELIKREVSYKSFFEKEGIDHSSIGNVVEIDYKILRLSQELYNRFVKLLSRGLNDPESRIMLQMLMEGTDVLSKRVRKRRDYITEISK